MGTLRDVKKSDEERSGQPADRVRPDAGYQALADFERWAALGAASPDFADRLAAAGSAAAAYRSLEQGGLPEAADPRLEDRKSVV